MLGISLAPLGERPRGAGEGWLTARHVLSGRQPLTPTVSPSGAREAFCAAKLDKPVYRGQALPVELVSWECLPEPNAGLLSRAG
jgi:hypothetical protein